MIDSFFLYPRIIFAQFPHICIISAILPHIFRGRKPIVILHRQKKKISSIKKIMIMKTKQKNYGRKKTSVCYFENEIILVKAKSMISDYLEVQRIDKCLVIYNSKTRKRLTPTEPNYYKSTLAN